MPKKLRKRREALWQQFQKKCFWCGCETIFPESGSDNKPKADNLATVEHLRSKFGSDRYEPNHSNEQRLVLACLLCNSLRAKLEAKLVLGFKITWKHYVPKVVPDANVSGSLSVERSLSSPKTRKPRSAAKKPVDPRKGRGDGDVHVDVAVSPKPTE